MPQKSIRQALNEALRQEMQRDPRIIVIGEDVAGGAASEGQRDAYGGVLGVTKGLFGEFGEARLMEVVAQYRDQPLHVISAQVMLAPASARSPS